MFFTSFDLSIVLYIISGEFYCGDADVSWKLEVGSWKLEVGSWKLEVGKS